MKTTVDIADQLLARAKLAAAAEGTTLRELIERGLRHELESNPENRYVLPDGSFDGNGVQSGVDEGDWSRLRELIYEGRGG
ncbi:MAG: DUF2191 domain-containing protein [Actinomycetota bacterium]|nr:DUF2191 domain-containing protein [Actinomycetota bacterium]